MLTVIQKQVCDATIKTSEKRAPGCVLNVLEASFLLIYLFMLDILTNGRGPNKVLLRRVSLTSNWLFKSS